MLAHPWLQVIPPSVAKLLLTCGRQALLDILGQVIARNKIPDEHRALRVEGALVDGFENGVHEWFNAFLRSVLATKGTSNFLQTSTRTTTPPFRTSSMNRTNHDP